jgi:GPH family glycoside/pentoside/hexuronide:cation symporter
VLFTGLAAIPLCQWTARRYGKRATMIGIMGLYIFAGLSTWVTFNPAFPWLTLVNSVFVSMASTAIWVLIPSMTGDVVDYDELETRERREGTFAASFSWTLKFSWSVASAMAGFLVVASGFDAQLKTAQPDHVLLAMRLLLIAVPLVFIGAALWVVAHFPLTTQRMLEIRADLEKRRGTI